MKAIDMTPIIKKYPGYFVALSYNRKKVLGKGYSPEEALKEAKKKGRQARPETLKAAGFVFVVADLEPDQASAVEVLELYRSPEVLRMADVAERLGTTFHNVQHVIKTSMPLAERKALAALRYSVSKEGPKNPMWKKTGSDHHNWIGECEDGYGYLTCLHGGKRCFVHRVVMAEALGLEELPERFTVHHIDGDPKNNDINNLALVTDLGHKELHYLQAKDSVSLALRKSTLLDAFRSMTSE